MFGLILLGLWGYLAAAGLRAGVSTFEKVGDKEWVKNHPYHIFLKYEVENSKSNDITGMGLFGGLLVVIAWAIGLILLVQGDPALWLAYAAGISAYLGVAFNYWAIRGIIRKIKELSPWIRQKTAKWWEISHPQEIQEAKAILGSIHKVIKGKKSKSIQGIMAKAEKLIKEELPRLLNLRQELTLLIDNAKQIIQKEKDNGIIEGEEQLMKESEKGLETLNKRLSDVGKKIRLIPTVLDHLCIQLSVIISSDSISEVQGIIDDVKMDLDIMLESHEEIAHLEAKYDAAREAARQQLHDTTKQAMEEIFPKGKEPAKVAEA